MAEYRNDTPPPDGWTFYRRPVHERGYGWGTGRLTMVPPQGSTREELLLDLEAKYKALEEWTREWECIPQPYNTTSIPVMWEGQSVNLLYWNSWNISPGHDLQSDPALLDDYW